MLAKMMFQPRAVVKLQSLATCHSEAYGSAWDIKQALIRIDTYRPCTKGYQKSTELAIGSVSLYTYLSRIQIGSDLTMSG
ncbi:hypothetical protein GGP41_010750 [Bipolaris sorokiniana]|uniref:Uncharacterized protein n=1 Tax=Cochliobolus sativus TaxID=45130 RepID=A0A8H5ZLJ4_COCSA|nr:hypothetical protein GGP41_010750 [Bipolaris sorokiniana]